MRPILKSFTPAAANVTGIATGLTGAGPFTTFTAAGTSDGLGHQLSFTSTANLSGINLTVVGKDADGNAQSEVLAGPNNNTVDSVYHYSSITSITASATLGASTMNVGWTGVSVSGIIVLDQRSAEQARCSVETTGTITYSVQETSIPVYLPTPPWGTYQAALSWADDTGISVNPSALIPSEMTALRLMIKSVSAGATISTQVVQAAPLGS